MRTKPSSQIRRIVVFLTIISLFLYIANLVVYEALVLMFNMTALEQKVALAIFLGIFSGSFISGTIIGTRSYNWFTRAYYTLSATWMGYFTYLFFSSVIYGFAVGVTGLPLPVFGMMCLLGAFLLGTYGLLHARKIRMKEISITLPNLPPAWRGRRAIWISDVHLGQIHGSPFAKRVVNMINGIPHDLVFIGGDLFDGTGAPDIEELVVPFGNCTAPLGTYFISGNHEEYGDNKRFFNAIRAVGIRVLIDEMVLVDGLQIIGVDYKNTTQEDMFREVLSNIGMLRDMPSLLLKHEPINLAVGEEAGISLQISGHTHNGQLWPLNYIANLVHKGYGYGFKNFKNMQVFVSSGTGTWGPPMRVGSDCEIVCFTFV